MSRASTARASAAPQKIVTVLGARPQFVKASVVSRALRAAGLSEVLVHTGQHFDDNMSEVFFTELDIPRPDYNLAVHGGGHGAMTGRMLERIEDVLLEEKPDRVLVYGDTNSTLAGALAAAKLHIPVAHVEAGLRSFNRRMPEEINRVLTDHVADLLFTPTDTASANLRQEGIADERIHQVGDVMYDAALHYGALADERSTVLDRLGVTRGQYVLATVHRAENTDDESRLRAIFGGLQQVAAELDVILPLHPRTRGRLSDAGIRTNGRLRMIDPVGYLDMIALEKNARVIATDSGGVQKEAFFFRVPCVTLRDETEWVETVELGWNVLVPARDAAVIADAVVRRPATSITDQRAPFGRADAATGIAECIGRCDEDPS
jgi:UDP-GlcNAc3NAcA epimerase